ncbi:MAG TPA: hypothetical protein VGE45_10790 [Chloroflexia bacterium]|jgi:tetratricopeptide (TPR) repeat protein
MLARLILVFVLFLAVSGVVIWAFIESSPATEPAPSAAAPPGTPATPNTKDATATPVITPTSTPTTGDIVIREVGAATEKLERVDTTLLDFGLAIAKLIALGLALLILMFGIIPWVMRLLFRAPELVVEGFTNASGDSVMDSRVVGLSQLLRENLVKRFEEVQVQVTKYIKDVGPSGYDPSIPFALPQETTDQTLPDLINALKESAPEQVKPLVPFLQFAATSRGTSITSILQRKGDIPGELGITLQLKDIRNRQMFRVYTVWEGETGTGQTSTNESSLVEVPSPVGHTTKQQAQAYYDVAMLLSWVGLYKDAIGFLEKTLKLDKTLKRTLLALERAVRMSQLQQSAALSYSAGKELQSVELLDEAIANYVRPLPARKQLIARVSWNVVLNVLVPGDKASAYLTLARFYRNINVGLFEEAMGLYKSAKEHGSKVAAERLDKIEKAAADHLAQAASILHSLAQYSDAEKYLSMAVKMVPNDKQKKAMLEEIKKCKTPDKADKEPDAEAYHTLGVIYEALDVQEKAITMYEEALKKDPAYEKARAGLQSVGASERHLSQRYIALFEAASSWLAAELLYRKMLADMPVTYIPNQRKRYKAQVHNFIGTMYQGYAPGYSKSFYELAINSFKQAIGLYPGWYQPYENLADTYSMQGKDEVGLDRAEPQRKALQYYDMALTQLQRSKDIPSPETRTLIRSRIMIGRATAQLLTGDTASIDEAKEWIESFVGETRRSLFHPSVILLHNLGIWYGIGENWKQSRLYGWRADSEMDYRLLYNLATWYAFALKENIAVPNAMKKGRRYLTYSLARNNEPDLWSLPDWHDPETILNEGVQELKLRLSEKLVESPGLREAKGDAFSTAMEEVLREAKWL